MRPGRRRTVFRIEEPSDATDTSGGPTIVWKRVGTMEGTLMLLKGQERQIARSTEIRVTHTLDTWYHPTLTARHRLVRAEDDRVFDVISAEDPTGARKRMVVELEAHDG